MVITISTTSCNLFTSVILKTNSVIPIVKANVCTSMPKKTVGTALIYLLCTRVELKDPHTAGNPVRKKKSLKYPDWLKMHFPAWSTVFLQTLF